FLYLFQPIIWAIMPGGNIAPDARRHAKRMAFSPVPLALYSFGEVREKLVGQLLGSAVDQALSELRQLAADLRLDLVGEQRAAVLLRELDHRAALGEAGHAALAFT